MPQPNQFPNLLPNSTQPTYDPLHPLGNRPAGGGTLIARADWSLHGTTPTSIAPGANWLIYGGASAQYTKVGDYLQGLYADNTSGGFSGGASIEFGTEFANLQEVFIEFDSRQPLAQKTGCKFCKIHNDENGTANTTYGCEGGNGDMIGVSFGDGVSEGNDVANLFLYDGTNQVWTGRNAGIATFQYKSPAENFVWDSNWHNFKIIHKYNSGTTAGNEVPDGRIFIMIDNVLRASATNIFNRHYTNGKRPTRITLGDWAQGNQASEVNFRNVKISSGWFV
jgi:hypothetical protein